MRFTCFFLPLLEILSRGQSFSPTAPPDQTMTSRRSFVQDLALASAAIVPVPAARADEVVSLAALESIKLVQRKLTKLELYIADSDYESFKQSLRIEPFSDLRKSCFKLVRSAEDTPDGKVMASRYKSLIANLEKMDSLATLGMRGKKLEEKVFRQSYNDVVQAFEDFLQVAEASVSAPM